MKRERYPEVLRDEIKRLRHEELEILWNDPLNVKDIFEINKEIKVLTKLMVNIRCKEANK